MNGSVLYDSRTDEDEILISYIVPMYNTERYVLEAIDSISCGAGKDIEVIVVDDGSTDNSANIVLDWMHNALLPCMLIRQSNSGPSAARMLGLLYARGEYVGFCDSDDYVDVASFKKALLIAGIYECDIILLRSEVFDSITGESHDFYDTDTWDCILQGKAFAVVTAASAPALFRLEPNTNTRLIKREYLEKEKISFPLGIDYFEDFTFHVAQIASGNIFMYDKTGYYYRVNRVGKLTDQKSAKRFDVLKSVELAFQEAINRTVDIFGWSYIIYMACKVICITGQNILVKDRKIFFEKASELIQKSVDKKLYYTCVDILNNQERELLASLQVGAVDFLVKYASAGEIRFYEKIQLLLNKDYGGMSRRVLFNNYLSRIRLVKIWGKC